MKKILLIMAATLFISLSSDRDNLIGTWTSSEDHKYVKEFGPEGMCQEYYDGVAYELLQYSIGPTCGIENDTEASFIRFEDCEAGDVYCFELNGLDEDRLYLTSMQNGITFIYFKL